MERTARKPKRISRSPDNPTAYVTNAQLEFAGIIAPLLGTIWPTHNFRQSAQARYARCPVIAGLHVAAVFLAEDFGLESPDVVRIQSQRIELNGTGWAMTGGGWQRHSGGWTTVSSGGDAECNRQKRLDSRSCGSRVTPSDVPLGHICRLGEEIVGRDHAFLDWVFDAPELRL